MSIKLYTKQFARLLPTIYESRAYFLRTFGGSLQVQDGVKETDTFLELKVSDTTEAVLQDYDTSENVAFGDGTGVGSRFGVRREIKSINKQVPYKKPLAIHEGIDNFTVNDIPDQVVAERLAKHAEAWTEYLNEVSSQVLSKGAHASVTGGVVQVFNEARKIFTNNRINRKLGRTAYITPEVYNYLVDNNLTTTAKHSSANVDQGTLTMFKGFILEEVPEDYFEGDSNIYFAVDNIAILGVGISIARTLDSHEFAGIALQGAGKYADYLPETNEKAIITAVASLDDTKATVTQAKLPTL